MDNVKNDIYYVRKIRKNLAFIVEHMLNVDLDQLNDDEVLLDSMLFRMIQISENAKNYPINIRKHILIYHGVP